MAPFSNFPQLMPDTSYQQSYNNSYNQLKQPTGNIDMSQFDTMAGYDNPPKSFPTNNSSNYQSPGQHITATTLLGSNGSNQMQSNQQKGEPKAQRLN